MVEEGTEKLICNSLLKKRDPELPVDTPQIFLQKPLPNHNQMEKNKNVFYHLSAWKSNEITESVFLATGA